MTDRLLTSAEAFEETTWRRSAAAYERYRERPTSAAMFTVFNECVSAPGSSRLFAGFDDAIQSGDAGRAHDAAMRILLTAPTGPMLGAARLVIGARTILVHALPAFADDIVSLLRDGDDGETPLDCFILRLRCRVDDPSNELLFQRLVGDAPARADVASSEWLLHRWRYEGPALTDARVFAEIARHLAEDAPKLHKALLALYVRLEDWRNVDDMLARRASLKKQHANILPLAAHLLQQGDDEGDLRAYAALHDKIEKENARLAEDLTSTTRRTAIVGNSPCQKGTGAGPLIDAHDDVVRFNFFELGPIHRDDYGEKFTIHARGPSDAEALRERSLQANRTVFCTCDFMNLPRNWGRFLELSRSGARLACLPAGFHRPLQQRLKAEPSLGLAFCAYAASLRGGLDRESCFGFAFTDQTGPEATAAHYFDTARPALTHRWAEERKIFHEFFERGRNSTQSSAP